MRKITKNTFFEDLDVLFTTLTPDFDFLRITLDRSLNANWLFLLGNDFDLSNEDDREIDELTVILLVHVSCLLIGWNFFLKNRSTELISLTLAFSSLVCLDWVECIFFS